MPKNNIVTKMLSPEEMTLLGTMQSTLNELLSLQQGGNSDNQPEGEQPQGDIMEALKKLAAQNNLGDNTEEMGDQNSNAPVAKENNGPTANENAEQRTMSETDINDKNLSEVGKALLSLITKSNNKPVVNNNNDMNLAIAKTLTAVVNKIESIEKFNSNILDALGYAEKIEKTQNLQQVNKSQNLPIQSLDATGIVNELVSVIKSMASNPQSQNTKQFRNDWNGAQEARKDLKSAMPMIFQNALNNQNK